MSPTLLELIVIVLLLLLAWAAGVIIAPLVLAPLIASWRRSKPPVRSRHAPEKNVTPPAKSDEKNPQTYGNPRR